MKKSLILLMILIATAFVTVASAQANPFVSGRPSEDIAPAAGFSLVMPYFRQIMVWQQQIHEAMTNQIEALKDGQSFTALWLLLAFCFGYGIFHVIAPGHGKVIVSSYFLGNRARWLDGVWAGLIMAIGHTVTAIALVIILNGIMGLGQLTALDKTRYVELAGYGMIMGIGLWLLARAARKKQGCASCCCGHDHHHGHGHHDHEHPQHAHPKNDDTNFFHNKQAVSLFTATSLVPCTGSMIVLLFTLAQGVLWAGVLSVIAIALGMWLTITVIGTAAIFLRHAILLNEDKPSLWRQRIIRTLNIIAALIITGTGGLLFSGTLYSLMGVD